MGSWAKVRYWDAVLRMGEVAHGRMGEGALVRRGETGSLRTDWFVKQSQLWETALVAAFASMGLPHRPQSPGLLATTSGLFYILDNCFEFGI